MKLNNMGKLFAGAAVADAVLNDGENIKKIAPACGCYVITVLGALVLGALWLVSKFL